MGSVCLCAVHPAFAVLGASVSAAASRWPLSDTCRAASPYLALGSLLKPLFPRPALRCRPKLAREVLVWVLLQGGDLGRLPSAPKLALWVAGLVCSCFGSPGLPSASRGCVRLSRARACTLRCPLHWLCVRRHTRLPGPPSVQQGLCALPGFVCRATLGSPSPPSVWGQGLGAVNGLRSAAFSVYRPPNACFAWFSGDFTAPLWARLWGVSLCTGTPPVSGLVPSLGAQAPAQKFSIFPLLMSPSPLLPHFRELNLSP